MSHHDDYPDEGRPVLGDLLLSVGAAIALGILFLTVYALLPGVAVQP
jgi:hypothetical protein